MNVFSDFLRSLEVIAARRPGSFGPDTPLVEVVGRNGIGPLTFAQILMRRFNKTLEELDRIDLRGGHKTLSELFCDLHAGDDSPRHEPDLSEVPY